MEYKIIELLVYRFSHTELAKLVLDKCSTANLPKWTYEYEYEFVEDFQNLYSKSERSTFGSTGTQCMYSINENDEYV